MKIFMPSFGESMEEGTIAKWLVEEGDRVTIDEPFVEITTEKLTNEVVSEVNGIITKLLVEEGQVVKKGTAIAEVQED